MRLVYCKHILACKKCNTYHCESCACVPPPIKTRGTKYEDAKNLVIQILHKNGWSIFNPSVYRAQARGEPIRVPRGERVVQAIPPYGLVIHKEYSGVERLGINDRSLKIIGCKYSFGSSSNPDIKPKILELVKKSDDEIHLIIINAFNDRLEREYEKKRKYETCPEYVRIEAFIKDTDGINS